MAKPTILIALDSHSAAVCAAIKQQLQQLNTEQSCLIQTYALTWDGQKFSFTNELQRIADNKFDLNKIDDKQVSLTKIRTQFEQNSSHLQTELIDLLKAANQSPEIIAAKQEGIEISKNHRVYLMLSASNNFARGVVFDLVRLLRWLFTKFFVDIPHSLEALLLLPSLFPQVTTDNYAAAYAFLKELDYKMTSGIVVTASQKFPPFENCWLCDERFGGLKDNLVSYADAFVGFLTLEPETNGLLIGTHKVRGKIPAYSSFGYAELFFPQETVMQRLSAALAADILIQEFLPQPELTPESNRKLLLDVKELVLSDEFSSIWLQLERDNGKPIWQDFNPRVDIHAGKTQDYGIELQRAYRQFENKELLAYKRTLENSRKQVQAALTTFLNSNINRYADAAPTGLYEAVRLLCILTSPYLELQTDSISEQPENLITELRNTEALLDSKLQVTVNRETSKKLLNQILSLKLQRQQLQDTLVAGSSPERLEELQKIQEQLETAITEYKQAVNTEIEQARQVRVTAINRTRTKAEEAIDVAQKQLNSIENQLETATEKLNNLLEEERRFRNRYLIIYPTFVVIGLVGLLILIGIFSQSTMWLLLQNVWNHLVNYLFVSAVTILIYLGIFWLQYSSGIREKVQNLQKQIKRLEGSLKVNAIELRRSYNERLKLDYDIYVQNLRVEALNFLIKAAKTTTETLQKSLSNVSKIYNHLLVQKEQATTNFSEIRLSVMSDLDIDAYYQNLLPRLPIKKFTQSKISRSQSWEMSPVEFEKQLLYFANQQFAHLSNLSVGEVLKESDLIAVNTANIRLNQLYDKANLLVRLQDIDMNLNPTSQRELTLWVAAKDKEQIFDYYSRLSRSLTALVSEDEQRLCVLTRSLGFPAYFLSQIEFYRDCYERIQKNQIEEDETIPDLIPEEIGSNRELKDAYQILILSIATGFISVNHQGNYQFKNQLLGKEREKIASAFATEFTFQEKYGELKEKIEGFDPDIIYQKLQTLATSTQDLTAYELKILEHLFSAYNPLN